MAFAIYALIPFRYIIQLLTSPIIYIIVSQLVDICLRTHILKLTKLGIFLIQVFILEDAETVEYVFNGLMSVLNDQVVLASEINELELRYTKC